MSELDRVILILLKKEIECLRSVLSEWEEDKSCYLQMVIADEIKKARETIEEL